MVDSSAQVEYLISAKECLNSADLESVVNSKTDVTSSAIDRIRKDVGTYISDEKSLIAKIDQAIREINSATAAVNKEIRAENERKRKAQEAKLAEETENTYTGTKNYTR